MENSIPAQICMWSIAVLVCAVVTAVLAMVLGSLFIIGYDAVWKRWHRDRPTTKTEVVYTDRMGAFWNEQAEWSRKTFGPDDVRHELGPTKHLAREVLTELLGISRDRVSEIFRHIGEALPGDHRPPLMEYVDCQFLIFDAARRRGFSYSQVLNGCFEKLEINKARTWPPFDPNNTGDAVEHVRQETTKAEAAAEYLNTPSRYHVMTPGVVVSTCVGCGKPLPDTESYYECVVCKKRSCMVCATCRGNHGPRCVNKLCSAYHQSAPGSRKV